MTTNYHAVFPTNVAADAAQVESRFSSLDTQITANTTAIGDLSLMGTTIKTNLAHALGYALLRTPETNTLTTAINSVLDLVVAAQAELDAASTGYASLDARLDNMLLSGSNVATTANGAASAGQKVVDVVSTTGFITGQVVIYYLVGGALERNVITVTSPTRLTMAENLGTGGIASGTIIGAISVSEDAAANAIPHAGTLMLQQTMEYANGGVFNVRSYGAKGDGTTDDASAIQAAITAAAVAKSGVVYLPPGDYVIKSTLAFGTTSPVLLRGAGQETYVSGGAVERRGTRLTWGGSATDAMISAIDTQGLHIENIGFWSGDVATITAIETDSDNNPASRGTVIRDCSFRNFSICVHVGVTDPYSIDPVTIDHCAFLDNYQTGVKISTANGYSIHINNCSFMGTVTTTLYHINAVKGSPSIRNCYFGKTKNDAAGASILVTLGHANISDCYSEGEYSPFFKWVADAPDGSRSTIIGCDLRMSNLLGGCINHAASSTLVIASSFMDHTVVVASASAYVQSYGSYISAFSGGNDANVAQYGARAGIDAISAIGTAGAGLASIIGTTPRLTLNDTDNAAHSMSIENAAGIVHLYRPGTSNGLKFDTINGVLDLVTHQMKFAPHALGDTSMGAVINKFAVTNAAGTVIGYVPIYATA